MACSTTVPFHPPNGPRNSSTAALHGQKRRQDVSFRLQQLSIPLVSDQRCWRFVMKSRTTPWAILAAVFLASHVHAQTLRVTIRKAPIRSGPGSQTTLVTHAMHGDLLDVVDVEGLWYIVSVPATQQVGYVHSALVEQTAQQIPQPSPAATRPSSPSDPAPPPAPVAAPILQPGAPPPPPPPRRTETPPPIPRTPPETAAELPKTQPSIDPSLGADGPWNARGLGIGMRTGWGTLGTTAFNFRTWGNSKGLSLDVSYLGNTGLLGVDGLDYSRLQMQPSLLFKIGRPITFSAVYLQPYAGGGANTIWHHGALFGNEFALGLAVFGGLDVGFMSVQNLTVSADLGYVSDDLWTTCGDLCLPSSFNEGDIGVTFGINWYFK